MGKAPPAGGQLEEGALRRPTGREAVLIGVGAVGGGCLRGLHLGGWRVVEGGLHLRQGLHPLAFSAPTSPSRYCLVIAGNGSDCQWQKEKRPLTGICDQGERKPQHYQPPALNRKILSIPRLSADLTFFIGRPDLSYLATDSLGFVTPASA